jgi:hypothetical protein
VGDHIVERIDDQPNSHRSANDNDRADDDDGNGGIHGDFLGRAFGRRAERLVGAVGATG